MRLWVRCDLVALQQITGFDEIRSPKSEIRNKSEVQSSKSLYSQRIASFIEDGEVGMVNEDAIAALAGEFASDRKGRKGRSNGREALHGWPSCWRRAASRARVMRSRRPPSFRKSCSRREQLAEQVASHLDEAGNHIGTDGGVGVFDAFLEGFIIGVGGAVEAAQSNA